MCFVKLSTTTTEITWNRHANNVTTVIIEATNDWNTKKNVIYSGKEEKKLCNLSKENEICANVPIKLYIVTFYYYEIFNEITKQKQQKERKKSIGEEWIERK